MATTPASGARKCQNWIDSFVVATEGVQSPLIFRKWAAIVTLAGAIERKVWARVFRRTLYANLYVMLVGGPGVGKTESLREVHRYWKELPDMFVAPSSVSRASLVDELALAQRQIARLDSPTEPFVRFNALSVGATEFGTFLSAYDTEFMSTLNDLYDGVRYKERKRHMKEAIEMENPFLNLIAGTTPAWLGNVLPESAWAEGFSSRVLMIYSGERQKVDPWAETEERTSLHDNLHSDLFSIHSMFGQMAFDEDVAATFKDWYLRDLAPSPEHPKLEHYLPRRHIHFLKLCIIMSVARSDERVIRMADYEAAQEFLLEAEAYMPDVFKSITGGGDSNALEDCFAMVWGLWSKNQKPVGEHVLTSYLARRIPVHNVKRAIETMVSMHMIKEVPGAGLAGRAGYSPIPRGSHDPL